MAKSDKTERTEVTIAATVNGIMILDPTKAGPSNNVHAAINLRRLVTMTVHQSRRADRIVAFLSHRGDAATGGAPLECHIVKMRNSRQAASLFATVRAACVSGGRAASSPSTSKTPTAKPSQAHPTSQKQRQPQKQHRQPPATMNAPVPKALSPQPQRKIVHNAWL